MDAHQNWGTQKQDGLLRASHWTHAQNKWSLSMHSSHNFEQFAVRSLLVLSFAKAKEDNGLSSKHGAEPLDHDATQVPGHAGHGAWSMKTA